MFNVNAIDWAAIVYSVPIINSLTSIGVARCVLCFRYLGLPEFFLLGGFGGLGRTPAYLRDVLISVAKCRARAQKLGAPACDK
jgi:hypothetical protein